MLKMQDWDLKIYLMMMVEDIKKNINDSGSVWNEALAHDSPSIPDRLFICGLHRIHGQKSVTNSLGTQRRCAAKHVHELQGNYS